LKIIHSTGAYNEAAAPSVPGDPNYDYRSGGGGLNINGDVEIINSLAILNTNRDCDLNQGLNYTRTGNTDADGTCGFGSTETNPMIDSVTHGTGSFSYYPLLPGSPLIDILPDCGGMVDDQISTQRPQGTACDPGAYEFIGAPAPPPPPSPVEEESETDSSLEICSFFEGLEMRLAMLDIPPGTTLQTIYITIPGGVPVLELEIPDFTNELRYRATLGSAVAEECTFEGYAERLYCTFDLSPAAFGTQQELNLMVGDCPEPAFTHPRVSIFEPAPVCNADFGQEACIEAGGEFKEAADTVFMCICPEE
jgi:hypothetical protein